MADQYDPQAEEDTADSGALPFGSLSAYASVLAARDREEGEALDRAYAPLRKRYEEAATRLREQRIGPSQAERLYGLGAALSAPMRYKGVGATVENLAPVLQEQSRVKRIGEEGRRDALIALEGKQDEITSDAELAKITGRRARNVMLDKMLLDYGKEGTGFNPVTGQLMFTKGPRKGQLVPGQPAPAVDGEIIELNGNKFRKDQKGNLVLIPRSPSEEIALAAGKAEAEESVKNLTSTAQTLPKVAQQANEALKQLADLRTDPGLSAVVGLPNPFAGGFGPLGEAPGSPAADAKTRIDQLLGGAFLQAFESLKGGGQITEVEGKKATDAMARLRTAQSEKAFMKALDDYEEVIRAGLRRAEAAAKRAQARAAAARAGGVDTKVFAPQKPGDERPPLSSFIKGG